MKHSDDLVGAGIGSCGARLADARQAAGLACEDVADRLKMPLRVVHALEADDLSVLGAPVFVRGQLRSYARLLGIDLESELARSEIAVVTPAELVSHSHTPRYQHFLEQATRRAIYIVLTAAIAVPVWLGMRPHLSNELPVASLDLPAGTVAQPALAASDVPPKRTPLIASMASMAGATAPALSINATGDTWLQVFAPDGSPMEQGMLAAGERRSYGMGEVGRVVLGNSVAVRMRKSGKPVNLEPFTRANVARFTLSSDGSLAPVIN